MKKRRSVSLLLICCMFLSCLSFWGCGNNTRPEGFHAEYVPEHYMDSDFCGGSFQVKEGGAVAEAFWYLRQDGKPYSVAYNEGAKKPVLAEVSGAANPMGDPAANMTAKLPQILKDIWEFSREVVESDTITVSFMTSEISYDGLNDYYIYSLSKRTVEKASGEYTGDRTYGVCHMGNPNGSLIMVAIDA